MHDERRNHLIEAIWMKVHDIVDDFTKDLSPDDDEEVREQLNETFRFWRR